MESKEEDSKISPLTLDIINTHKHKTFRIDLYIYLICDAIKIESEEFKCSWNFLFLRKNSVV